MAGSCASVRPCTCTVRLAAGRSRLVSLHNVCAMAASLDAALGVRDAQSKAGLWEEHQTTNLGAGSSNLSGRANKIRNICNRLLSRKWPWRAYGEQSQETVRVRGVHRRGSRGRTLTHLDRGLAARVWTHWRAPKRRNAPCSWKEHAAERLNIQKDFYEITNVGTVRSQAKIVRPHLAFARKRLVALQPASRENAVVLPQPCR
jgi:hypothetical protein